MKTFHLDLKPAAAATQPIAMFPEWMKPSFAYDPLKTSELEFGTMGEGGWHTAIRAGVVRLAFMKLAATGVLAAFIAINNANFKVSFSCSLAASVNFVACVHYLLIWKIRAQAMPRAYVQWGARRDKNGKWLKKDIKIDAKYYAQEVAVDSLRYSDWTITLVLMNLDLFEIAEHATGGKKHFLDKYICSALMPVMIGFGAVYRFWYNEGRADVLWPQTGIAWTCFCVSCAIFVLVLSSLVGPLLDDGICPAAALPLGTDGNGRCPILDSDLKKDAIAVMLLSFVWVGYPLVSVAARVWQGDEKNTEFSGNASLFKDIAYATLDIASKAGLALYAVYRSFWI